MFSYYSKKRKKLKVNVRDYFRTARDNPDSGSGPAAVFVLQLPVKAKTVWVMWSVLTDFGPFNRLFQKKCPKMVFFLLKKFLV